MMDLLEYAHYTSFMQNCTMLRASRGIVQMQTWSRDGENLAPEIKYHILNLKILKHL